MRERVRWRANPNLHGLLVREVLRHLRLAHLDADLVHHYLRVVRRLEGATVRGSPNSRGRTALAPRPPLHPTAPPGPHEASCPAPRVLTGGYPGRGCCGTSPRRTSTRAARPVQDLEQQLLGDGLVLQLLLQLLPLALLLVQQHVQRAHADHGREAHHGVAVAHARGISPRWPHRTRPIGASRVWSVFHPLNLAVTPSE